MPPLVSRILMTVFLVPIAGLFYTLAFVWANRTSRSDYPFTWIFAGALSWLILALGFFLIWRTRINWTRRRISLTISAAIASVLLASIFGVVASFAESGFGWFLTSALAPALWLLATAVIWSDSPAEFVQRQTRTNKSILCPTCNYNLTGLTEARCPECGASFTLDALFAAQSPESTPSALQH
jgi:uncharacterized paraquat-inducible protein A